MPWGSSGLACDPDVLWSLKNLFLRKQLTLYLERKVSPRRAKGWLCLQITPTVLKSLMFSGPHCYSPSHANRVSFISVRFVFLFPKPRLPASGESGPAPPDQRPAAGPSEATPPEAWGSSLMGLALASMDGLALRPGNRQARNSDRLAPQGLSSVLDLEKQKRSSWEAGHSPESSGSHP